MERVDVEGKPVPPDGGWGYVIAFSHVVLMYIILVPYTSFGIYYGSALAAFGDEAGGTAVMTAVLTAVVNFTGFASSFLLRKYSNRLVAFIGATSFFIGSISEIFATNLAHLVISSSVFKGFAYGLIQPAALASINSYFQKRHNLVIGVIQTFIAIGSIICPLIMAYAAEHIGFRNISCIIAGLSLINFPLVATLRPADRYIRKDLMGECVVQVTGQAKDITKLQAEPLLLTNVDIDRGLNIDEKKEKNHKKSTAVVVKEFLLDTVGLRLFRDLRYVNMCIGLALGFNSDYTFTVIIRMVLNQLNFDTSDIAKMLMVYFCCDLLCRLIYSSISYFCTINNKMLFFFAIFTIAVHYIAFALCKDHTWKFITIGLIGFTRALVETPLPLVVSEMYKENFSTAFSLYMVVSGCIGFLCGWITRYVSKLTENGNVIVYFLAISNFIGCFLWAMEMIYLRITGMEIRSKQKNRL